MKATNVLDMSGLKIVGLADATSAQEAVTKAQLDAAIQGYKWKDPGARVATTSNISLSGLQTIDGVAVALGDYVLVKNQSSQQDNGLYVASSGGWSRSPNFDLSAEIIGSAVFVSEGVTQGNTAWLMTTDAPIVMGTTDLVFTQFGGGSSYSAGLGIIINSGVIEIDTSITARKVAATIGDGVSTTITVTHNLGTRDVVVSIYEASTYTGVLADWVANGVNTVQITFANAPTVGQYRISVMG
ncbi:hypothetical protein JCM14076_06650 [Methylosoma difficile]